MEDRCVMCGEIIPEGRMVCPVCEERVLTRKGERRQRGNTGHILPSVRGRNEGQRKEVSAVQIRTRLRESQSEAGDRVALDKICEQRHRVLYVVCVRVRLRLQQPRSEQFSLRPGLCHRSESNQIISARHAGHRRSKRAGR